MTSLLCLQLRYDAGRTPATMKRQMKQAHSSLANRGVAFSFDASAKHPPQSAPLRFFCAEFGRCYCSCNRISDLPLLGWPLRIGQRFLLPSEHFFYHLSISLPLPPTVRPHLLNHCVPRIPSAESPFYIISPLYLSLSPIPAYP